jgi:heptosyltransferase II
VPDRWRASLRAFERRLKSLIIKVLGAIVRPRGTRAPLEWDARPHRILYLRYDRIGDMVLATGIIKAIRLAQPNVTVDVLASVGNAAVLRGNPHVGRVFTIDRKRLGSYLGAVRQVRRARYDAVVDAMVMAPSLTTMLLMWASGARHRIGVADRGNDFALTVPVPRVPGAVHYVDHSAAVLAAFGADPRPPSAAEKVEAQKVESRHRLPAQNDGVRAPVPGDAPSESPQSGWGIWVPELYLTPGELDDGEARWREAVSGGAERPRGRRLVVNVSAGAPWRYWPDERFVAVLDRIRTRFPDVSMLIIGAPEDDARMTRIGRAAGVPFTRTGHYRQMMAIVAASDFAFTADTSVTHIASAFHKPVVAMFGRSRGPLYGPYGTSGCAVSVPGLTLDAVEVEPVAEALEAVIAAGSCDTGAA